MTEKQNNIIPICALVIGLVFAWGVPAEAAWVVTELPTLPTWTGDTEANDINDSGAVCGFGNSVSGVSCTAFRYNGAILTELPYLDPSPATYQYANASAINSSGVIAGRSHNANGDDRAVFWSASDVITEIPLPADGDSTKDMRGYGINDAGVVVGYYVGTNGFQTAFYYDGSTHSLRAALVSAGLAGNSYSWDVNNNGVICGEAQPSALDTKYHFFTYDIAGGTATDLGQIVASESYFTKAINDDGDVVGRGPSTLTSPNQGLLHDGTSYNIIDPTVLVHQWASDINNDGRIVGCADKTGTQWAWYSDETTNGSMIQTDLSGWDEENFQGINNHDVMIGHGTTTPGGDSRGFIVAPPPGDYDHNGFVDLDDYAVFAGCISGPKEGAGFVAPSEACLEAFDLAPSAESYVVTEVPVLPSWSGGAEAIDINSSGVVCGHGNYTGTTSTAFRYDGFTITELDNVNPALPVSLAYAINADGVICGQSRRIGGHEWERAVYWEDTAVITIPELPDMNTNSYSKALDINDSGVIVGFYYSTNGERVAYYYETGTTYSLDSAIRAAGLYGMQTASGINNNGIISGSAYNTPLGSTTSVFTYDLSTGIATNIGNAGYKTSAVDINESGQTIGRGMQNSSDSYHAVTYDGSWHLVDSTVTSSQWGEAINDLGRMVGHANIQSNKWSWYSDGPGDNSIIQLSLPGWTEIAAQSINNDNVIVGYGENASSEDRGFILTPDPGDGDIDLEDFAVFQEIFEGP